MPKETIFALSTALGKAGIAIVRVSGSKSFDVIKKLAGVVPSPRVATLCTLKFKNDLIDRALIICFRANASYTGEDMVEFHIHGGAAVISGLLEVLSSGFYLTVANPGEFTRRALENGCMDLSQVEAVIDLINSETKEQRNQSLKMLSGIIGDKSKSWRGSILSALALVEVMIDFSDEEVPDSTVVEALLLVNMLLDELSVELDVSKSLELVRQGFDVTIIGKPNVGKSSLLNYLAGREKAIVSEEAGTTRDIIELSIDLKGFRVNFFDTAGIHASNDKVELIGIEKARKKALSSNITIFLVNPNEFAKDFGIVSKPTDMIFCAKSDVQKHLIYSGISSQTGDGVSEMLEEISTRLIKSVSYSGVLVNERHRRIITSTLGFLKLAKDELKSSELRIEIVAEHLRLAILELDFLVGKINVEDVLGDIFSSFCIGK